MYKGLDIKTRMGLLLAGKKAGLSYHDTIKDYDDSYKKFELGGEVKQEPVKKNDATHYYTSDINDYKNRKILYNDSSDAYKVGEQSYKFYNDNVNKYLKDLKSGKTNDGIKVGKQNEYNNTTYSQFENPMATVYDDNQHLGDSGKLLRLTNNYPISSRHIEYLYNPEPINKPQSLFSNPFNTETVSEDKNYMGDISYKRYKKPTQEVIYQPKPVDHQTLVKTPNKPVSDYERLHPPIYLTNPNDPRIGGYSEPGNEYKYQKPVEKPKPVINKYTQAKQVVLPQISVKPIEQAKQESKPISEYTYSDEHGITLYNTKTGKQMRFSSKEERAKHPGFTGAVPQYNHGGVHEDPPSMQLPNQYYNPSETVNQQPVINPYQRAQQINKSNYIPALTIEQQKERDKQEYINQYVKEGVKKVSDFAPFKAAAYLTPAGMAVGAIEGASNIGPDLYNKEYGSAALDAVSMLPFASNYKEAYKYNPWRFKADPEAYYHRSPDINQVLVDNKLVGYGLTSEGKKITEAAIKKYGKDIVNLKKAANDEPYFSKGTPLDWGRYNPVKSNWAGRTGEIAQGYKGPYLAEAKNVDFVAKADNRLQKVWSKDGTTWERGIAPNEIGAYATPVQGYVPKENLNFYKEHWWKGYKKINK